MTSERNSENNKSEKNFSQKELRERLPFDRKNFSDKVLKFFDDYNIPYTDKQKRWDWINRKTAPIYYREIIYPDVKGKLNRDDYYLKNGEAPTLEQIKKYGHLDFASACTYRGIKYNDILRGVGLKINIEMNRWEGLNLEKAAINLLNILNEGLREKLGLADNESPTLKQLNDNGFRDFASACRKRRIKINDVIIEAGLKINKEMNRWEGLDLEKAAEHLLKILNGGLKEKLDLADNEAPTMDQLIDNGYGDFLRAYTNRGIKHNDILRKVVLKINLNYNRWEGLNLEEASINLLDILNGGLREKLGLADNEGPTFNQLIDNGYGDFLRAYTNRGIKHNDVLKESGLIPHGLEISIEIGNNFHYIAERIFVEFFREKGCFSYWEINPNKLSDKNNLNHCDNCCLIDFKLRESLKLKNLYKNIEMVNIDYYLKYSKRRAIKKSHKSYQGKEKMLILVPIFSKEKIISPPKNIPYRKNVKIMNPDTFKEFVGYEGRFLREFDEAVKLARESFFDKNARIKLKLLAEECKELLNTKYKFKQDALESRLKERNRINVLTELPSDTGLLKWLQQDNNKKNYSDKREER